MLCFKSNCRLAILVLFLFVVWNSTALKFSRGANRKDTIPIGHEYDARDLTTLVHPTPHDQHGIYAQAHQLLTSMQALPSCSRLAASILLDSCHSIETADSENPLDDVKSLYAAQLAICEILGADSTIPQACKALTPVPEMKLRRDSTQLRKAQLGHCLQCLESRPQWWTSYSNSRQNAMVMCQATRVDVEKDELINLHKSMVKTQSDVNGALSQAVKESNDGLRQLQNDFTLAKLRFQEQLMRDIEASSSKVQSFFEQLVKSLDSAIQTTVSKVTLAARSAESDVAHFRQNVQKASADSKDLEKNVGRVFQQAIQGGAELAAIQTKQWDLSRGLATDLADSLQSMREVEVNAMLSALQTSNELVSFMYSRQNALDERLRNLDGSFAGLQTRAEAFHTILSNVTASAMSLQTTMQDTIKSAEFATFGGVFPENWTWLGFVALIIYQFSRKFTVILVATIGLGTLLIKSIPRDTVLIHYASGSQIPVMPLLKAVIALSMLTTVVILYVSNRSFRPERFKISNHFPFRKLPTSKRTRCTRSS